MQLTEFKAWFEGYTEALKGPPSVKQWERIKARIAEIDGAPITEKIYLDRYWPRHYPPNSPWFTPWYVSSTPPIYTVTAMGGTPNTVSNQVFNSSAGMYQLGQAEAGAES